jgi:hypothetical protein
MKNGIQKVLSLLFVFIIFGGSVFSQYQQYYDVLPDISQCKTGSLKQSTKDNILNYLNKIRDLHKLPHFEYDASFDDEAMEIALICAANGALSHTPDQSWHCYSQTGYNGGISTNLFLGSGTSYTCESSVVSWMNDRNQIELGHRRWIIDPFVKKIAFGRVDGVPVGGQSAVSAMAYYYDSQNQGNISSVPNDFVACPYGDYPPSLWDFGWSVLSFTVIADKSNRWNNNSELVKYASTLNGQPVNEAYVEVEDEDGNIQTFKRNEGLGWAYDNYGIPNYCYWQMHGLEQQKVYQVRIYDVLVNGQKKNFSYEFAFRDPFITKPGTCILSQPQNNSTDINPNVRFEWGTAQGADFYILEISKTQQFGETDVIYHNENISATSYQVSGVLEPMKKYYWRVAGRNDAGTGDWSSTWNFTTTTAPDAPTLAGPADNATEVSLAPILEWNEADKADVYHVQVAETDVFSSTLVDEDDIEQTSYTVESGILTTETEYFWRVRSISNISGPSAWSEVRNFTTASAAPEEPELLSPPQGATGVSGRVELVWQAVPGAETYDLQVSKDNLYSQWDVVIDEEGLTGTRYRMPGDTLELETRYYWRVRSNGPGGTSDWSRNGRFTVGDASDVNDCFYDDVFVEVFPNPVYEIATLDIIVNKNEYLTLKIYNSLGEEVDIVVNGKVIAGEYLINYDFSRLANGIYYYQLSGTKTSISGKINVIK